MLASSVGQLKRFSGAAEKGRNAVPCTKRNQVAFRKIAVLHPCFFFTCVWGCVTVDFPGESAQTQCILVVYLLGRHMCMFPKYSRGYVKGNWHTPRTPFEEWQQVAVGCSGSLGPSIKAIIPSVLDYITENEYTGESICYVFIYTLHHNMPLWILRVHVLFSYVYIYAYT